MSAPAERATPFTTPAMTWATWVLVVVLAFVHLFITYRGQVSAAAMDQAQVARELARGQMFKSKVICPASITQAARAGHETPLVKTPATLHPPLQAMLWAPVFYALKPYWAFQPGRTVYLLDRAMAGLGIVFFIFMLVLVHGMARRLFDRTVASVSVLALTISQPLWEVATNGGARMTLMLLATLAFYFLVLLTRRVEAGETAGLGLVLCLSTVCGLMVATHWGGLWLVLGVVLTLVLVIPGQRGMAIMVSLVATACAVAWLLHNKTVCGDFFGAAKPLLQGLVNGQSVAQRLRDFDDGVPPPYMGALVRRLTDNSMGQLKDLFQHFGYGLPALFFFVSLIHRFRRDDTMQVRTGLLITWGLAFLGMTLVGLPEKAVDDNQLHIALVPTLTVFGVAGMAVFWARRMSAHTGFWNDYGYAVVALVVTGWSMMASMSTDLRVGLFFRDQLQQWPPYNAPNTSELGRVVKPHQLLASDAPWEIAWYADRSCVWLPRTKAQLLQIRSLASQQSTPLVGVVITPLATLGTELASIRNGPYAEWSDLIFRGPVAPFNKLDLLKVTNSDFPFRDAYPMGYLSAAEGEPTPAMMLFADRSLLTP